MILDYLNGDKRFYKLIMYSDKLSCGDIAMTEGGFLNCLCVMNDP